MESLAHLFKCLSKQQQPGTFHPLWLNEADSQAAWTVTRIKFGGQEAGGRRALVGPEQEMGDSMEAWTDKALLRP